MSNLELWEHMRSYAPLTRLWWYTYAALPATTIAVGVYLVMAIALRRRTNPPAVFFWLFLATIPVVLLVPALLASLDLALALGWFGVPVPLSPQTFSLVEVRHLAAGLDTLALIAMTGAALAALVLVCSFVVGEVPMASPVFQDVSVALTRAVTRAVPRARSSAPSGNRYGVLRVTQGAAQGSQFAVRNALLGKQDADIIITDPIVSRRHARIEVAGEQVRLWNEQSRNGTYVQRHGALLELEGDPLDLEDGDLIFLGPPDNDAAVCIVYERGRVA